MSEKAREFWIDTEELSAFESDPEIVNFEVLHVIEYSAFEEMRTRYGEECRWREQKVFECEKLQAMLKIAEETIELTVQEALPIVKRRLKEALTRISEIKKGTT